MIECELKCNDWGHHHDQVLVMFHAVPRVGEFVKTYPLEGVNIPNLEGVYRVERIVLIVDSCSVDDPHSPDVHLVRITEQDPVSVDDSFEKLDLTVPEFNVCRALEGSLGLGKGQLTIKMLKDSIDSGEFMKQRNVGHKKCKGILEAISKV